MTHQEQIWFDALVRDREENARILAKDSMVGYRQSPIDKYSDRAHFVYEFLQNADDAKARKCVFSLYRDRLLFKHNGTVPFSVSDPYKESEDRSLGRLGGVNAITAAGLSTKCGNEIGRFGIGFKAVFQYTDAARIYDDNIRFGLRDEIVPYLLEKDLEGRQARQTCFEIPFRDSEEAHAYNDIKEKVKSITYPLLFLSNLEEISFESLDLVGRYSKRIFDKATYNLEDGTCVDLEFIVLKKEFGLEKTEDRLLKFSRGVNKGRVSVVFGVDTNNGNVRLVPLHKPVFCFFPTKKDAELNFLIHAPFLLNDSREGIKVGQSYNDFLIITLAFLVVQSIKLMVSRLPAEVHDWFGQRRRGINLVDDGILDFVPLNLTTREDEVSFLPFKAAFELAFKNDSLIPCREGNSRSLCYRKADVACWSRDNGLIRLFTSEQLALLLGRQQLYWGFATVEDVSKEKSDFIQSCCENIVWSLIRPKLTATFFEHQPIEWFKEFFDYISRDYWNVDSYKTLPIFIDNRNKAVSAFDEKGNHILYLPDDGYSTSSTINPSLLQFASVKKIVAHWNIVKESRLSIVKRIIREDLANGDANLYAKGFVEVLRFCNSCSDDDLRRIGDAFKESPALYVCNLVDNKREREKADDCYYPTEDLCLYFKGCESIAFVDVAYLKELAGNENHAALEKLFSILAIRKVPKCFTELKQFDIVQLYGKTKKWHYSYKQGYERWEDFYIHKSKHFFESFDSETDGDLKKKMSVVLWKFLCQIICQTVSGHSHIEDKLKGVHHYYCDRRWQIEEYETILHRLLRNSVWLFDNRGNLTPHSDLFVETLSNEYEVRSSQAKQLLELLGIEHNERLRALNTLSDEERADLSAAKEIRDCGFGSLEEVKAILTNVPDKVRRKISAGELSAAKILEAVNLLERTEAEGHNLVVQERKEMSPQHMKMLGQDGNVREVDDVVGTVMSVSVADGQYAGLSKDAQANVLHEAKELVKVELEQQGYEFTNGICEDKCSIIDGVQKHGIDYPLVVHSYLDDTRQFQLNAADWAQLMKPNSMLWVRTRKGVCSIPFRELVSNRERIELSFSTSNLEIGDRIDALASVLRWFTRLHFDFGKLIPSCVGVIQAFDLPEKAIPRDKKESELSEDPEEGVL